MWAELKNRELCIAVAGTDVMLTGVGSSHSVQLGVVILIISRHITSLKFTTDHE